MEHFVKAMTLLWTGDESLHERYVGLIMNPAKKLIGTFIKQHYTIWPSNAMVYLEAAVNGAR